MSQTTEIQIQNQNGLSFRTKLNQMLSALNTVFSGATAPTVTEANMLWMDTSVTPNILKRRNSSDTTWEIVPLVEGATNASSSKTTPVDADLVPLLDSTSSFSLKKLSWTNIKATLKTYFDTLYVPFSGGTLTGLLKFAAGTNIASASTVNLSTATGNTVHITGTTTITAWTMSSGQFMQVIFDGALQLTHNATTNNLQGGANITTVAGDRAFLYYDGTTVYVFQYIRADGTSIGGSVANQRMSLVASVATTSGTAIDFTGIPSWAKKITVNIAGVSTTGSSPVIVQLGTTSGVETSGYSGQTCYINNASSPTVILSTVGFGISAHTGAADTRTGVSTISLLATTVWVFGSNVGAAGSTSYGGGAGTKTLANTLNRLRLTTVGGTDTFDAGSISLLIEGY